MDSRETDASEFSFQQLTFRISRSGVRGNGLFRLMNDDIVSRRYTEALGERGLPAYFGTRLFP